MASPPEATATRESWSAWRIADGRFDLLSPVGASLVGGRWNSPGQGVIYASRSFAGAMLECLVHAGIGRIPKTHACVEIEIPVSLPIEKWTAQSLPAGWDRHDLRVSRAFGDAWVRECRSLALLVPSVVARREDNVVLNPAHPGFKELRAGPREPVIWDARLFGKR